MLSGWPGRAWTPLAHHSLVRVPWVSYISSVLAWIFSSWVDVTYQERTDATPADFLNISLLSGTSVECSGHLIIIVNLITHWLIDPLFNWRTPLSWHISPTAICHFPSFIIYTSMLISMASHPWQNPWSWKEKIWKKDLIRSWSSLKCVPISSRPSLDDFSPSSPCPPISTLRTSVLSLIYCDLCLERIFCWAWGILMHHISSFQFCKPDVGFWVVGTHCEKDLRNV